MPLKAIRVNRFQPRKNLDETKIQELANSIRSSGLIYPLLVRKIEESGSNGPSYELIAGERRFRALSLLGESEAPVIIKEASDGQSLELSLVENLQRQELNPIEEALAFQRLCDQFDMTQEEVSAAVGKDRATVANTLRLLKLSQEIRELVAQGRLSLGHARAILSLDSDRLRLAIAQRTAQEGLSVRQVEEWVRRKISAAPPARRGRDPHVLSLEEKLTRALATKVEILHGRKRGVIRIHYFSLKDLDRILARLT
ncbi:MAG: ParB/RepB/Spo0J family partition protein [Candidatus Omnitrophica bacterium]|nr:ParB/RepB/Spo0J family partition protein [Candidatus Omnitrophota bacterium]